MKINAAAIQMACEPLKVVANLNLADAHLHKAHRSGAELAVLPEMFNTGYGFHRDYAPYGEGPEGPTLSHLRQRSRQWGMAIAAGFVERDGPHLYDALAFLTPDGAQHVYRKRNLVFWERSRFQPGRAPLIVSTRWGRIGFGICADMIFRKVWEGYRDRIDLAIVSAAWPDFADRQTGRKHWLLGHVGPLSGTIPAAVARDLDIPVIFANQSGTTLTRIPLLGAEIPDRFAGQSSICDGRHGAPARAGADQAVVVTPITVHPQRGLKTWRTMSHSAPAA